MFGFKTVVAAVTVATMIGSSAFAADGTFAPGKPAGLKPAQDFNVGPGTLIVGGVAVAVVAGISIVVSNQSGDRAPATQTFSVATTNANSP